MFEEVRVQQAAKEFDNRLRFFVVVSALFPEGSMDKDGVASRMKYLKHFKENGNMSFADMIWGVEAYLDSNPRAEKAKKKKDGDEDEDDDDEESGRKEKKEKKE